MQTSSYNIFPIKPPISPTQLTAYKTLRLTSLQVDPHAFGSNYAREVAFTEDVWRQRLDSPFKQTFIASTPYGHVNGDEPIDAGEAVGEWIGTATIMGPSGMLPSIVASFREAGVAVDCGIYGLYAMWVHPAHRGQGIATQLVNACLEWVRTNVDTEFSGESGGNVEKVVVLLVHDDNVAAHALYSRTGFVELEQVSVGEGEMWMLARMTDCNTAAL